ncbi:Mediator of replication checkpoint protein 1 [Colletotrichum trifolii]|uniref:Mediator of replication checkpoint protein 1 n=1 Tax=Colletotrichum trifolii TaxID=5466 RepID=A0A4R8QP64_COLTR|nr:Mediator of replication checkpoint protein 1 [Colletotrichum trifolii]
MASPQLAARSPSASPSPDSFQSRMATRLAAIDASSDDDEPQTTNGKSKALSKPANDTESEEESLQRPRGRLAAQMHAAAQKSNSEELESFQDRIRKRLEAAEEAEYDENADDTAMAEDEDVDVSAAPRRLQRKQRDTTPKPQSPAPQSSPGLFVTPDRQSPAKPANETAADDSDSDALPSLKKNSRFQALVERKRQERLAREAEEEKKKAERMERQEATNVNLFDDDDDAHVSDITDDEGGRKLSQAVRPARRAGKKAIEEMNRETQRMARNMQLAHEAKTRKKFSKADFLERFNFKSNAPKSDPKTTSSSRPATPISGLQTDTEMRDAETPPSSPPVANVPAAKVPETTAVSMPPAADEDDELPSLDEVFEASKKIDKGKGKAISAPEKSPAKEAKARRQVRIKLPPVAVNNAVVELDDDLEITNERKARVNAVLDKIPGIKAREPKSLVALRALARLGSKDSYGKRGKKPSMNAVELQLTLQQRAREQARAERDKRLEYLRSKGVVIQTAEEREREMQEVEDIVAKARKEAEEIMNRERELAKEEKRQKRKNGEIDGFDDSDDEEYEGSEEEAENPVEIDLSGSEDEDIDASEEEEEEDGNALVDNEAGDSGSEHSDAELEIAEKTALAESDDDLELPAKNVRRSKTARIVSDDEDEDMVEATPRPKMSTQRSPVAPNTKSPAAPNSVLRSAKKTFIPGLPVTGAAGLGLTQIFAGTMDDSQAATGTAPYQSPMPDFDSLPDSNLIANTQPESMILDSQSGDTQRVDTQPDSAEGVYLHFTQSQVHGFDSFLRDDEPATQVSVDATQDIGPMDYTPLRSRFVEAPASTVETMALDDDGEQDTVLESPLVRRGRLRRKADVAAMQQQQQQEEEEEPTQPATPEVDEFGFNTTAFNVMKDAAELQRKRKKAEEYNRKKSKAKEMVHEQAEESEDEYAGLGGADGEDSDDDDTASVKEMIDDQAGMTADDERKLAALHAERERESDEKMVDKLFHDITTGMLRRKRGADYELSDSDDGGEARRRMKRRQFQKMQKALFADERIKKMAEKPGSEAFLRTLEDRDSDDEMDFLNFVPDTAETEDSQSQDNSNDTTTVPDSQPTNTRQPLAAATTRPFANQRRTKDGKKPSNIGEIRESVSSLLEDLDAGIIPATDPASNSDDDADDESRPRSDKENTAPTSTNPRRTTRPAVVDRLSLKRNSSSNMSTTSARLAFAMPSSSGTSFKVPNLLRRATTNSSSFKSSSDAPTSAGGAASGSGGGFGDDGKIKKTASKRSGVSALARENERRAAVRENEKRREARKWKGAEMRVKAVGGLFGGGKFE